MRRTLERIAEVRTYTENGGPCYPIQTYRDDIVILLAEIDRLAAPAEAASPCEHGTRWVVGNWRKWCVDCGAISIASINDGEWTLPRQEATGPEKETDALRPE